jgi:hypothetical protein
MLAPRLRSSCALLSFALLAGCPHTSVTHDAGSEPPADAADAVADLADATADDVADAPPPMDATQDDAPDAVDLDAPDVAPDGGPATDAWDDADAAPADDVILFQDASCGASYAEHTPDPGVHVDFDADITWDTNPPSSGPHYPVWAHWGVHTETLPRGYYVHNEEHGGVVVLYNCSMLADCAATSAALQAWVLSLPPEPMCMGTGVSRRIVLTRDDLIDTPVAAAAWGWTYAANCVDTPSLAAFVFGRTGHGPEDFCDDGYYP